MILAIAIPLPAVPDQRGNAVEIFLRVVVDDDLPPLGRFGSDQHGGAEPLVQMLFKLDQVGQPGLRGVCLIATDSRPSRGGNAGGHEGLGLADREVLGDDPAAGGTLALRVGQPQQGAGVARGDLAVADGAEDLVGQLQQPDQVGDGRAVQAQPPGELFLSSTVTAEILAKGRGLFDGIEVLSLQVFDHRQLEDALVVQVQHPRGNLVELGLDAGPEPPFAGDELVALADGSHQDWLEHAVLAQRIRQGGNLCRREITARLIRVGIDLIDGDVEQLGALERAGLEPPLLTSQQGFQTASQASLIHGR